MKKSLALLCMVLFSATSIFALDKAAIEGRIAGAVASNKNAMKKNLRVDFKIKESVIDYDDYEENLDMNGEVEGGPVQRGPYEADLACKAYALDDHWVIVSGTCMRYSPDPVQVYEKMFHERTGRKIVSDFNVNGHAISAKNYAYNNHVMLLWTGDKNTVSFLANLPKVNVLAVSTPNKLFALSDVNAFKINTARFDTDAIRTRTLKTGSIKGNLFQLDEGVTDLSGTATDPLFLVTPAEREFLVGYNNGVLAYALQITFDDAIHSFDGRTSREYFSLDLNDLKFIKETVSKKRPGDWERIKNRLFFNQTSKPYFK